jgi:hypothetical protein
MSAQNQLPIDELDRPRSVRDLAAWLNAHGEEISASQLFRYIKMELIPVVRIGPRGMRTTARHNLAALTPPPKVGA